jgi:hypothetical protein
MDERLKNDYLKPNTAGPVYSGDFLGEVRCLLAATVSLALSKRDAYKPNHGATLSAFLRSSFNLSRCPCLPFY